jgi:hypothetical protein
VDDAVAELSFYVPSDCLLMPSSDTQRHFLPAKTILETETPRKKDVPLTFHLMSLMPQTFPQGTYCSSPLHIGGKHARVPRRLEVASRQVRPLKARGCVTSCHHQTNANKLSQHAHTSTRCWLGSHDQTGYKGESEPAMEYMNHSLTYLQAYFCCGHWRA